MTIRRLALCAVVGCLIASCAAIGFAKGGAKYGEYLASRYTNEFHEASCESCGDIDASDLVVFHSPEEAINAGYKPCKLCNPVATPAESGHATD